VSALLDARNAHCTLEDAAGSIATELRGTRPAGLPYSPWELLEHVRVCQRDILEYCVNPSYREGKWPDDYWPASSAPPTARSWDESLAGFRKDLRALQRLAANRKIDLLADLPHVRGVTYLQELLLVADHNAYHAGQMVVLSRLLGQWKR
jgi:hypothetical protein